MLLLLDYEILNFVSDAEEKDEERKDDMDVVPAGKVSERMNAFEGNSDKPEPKLSQGPTMKRSESNLTSDMQKKYQVMKVSLKLRFTR